MFSSYICSLTTIPVLLLCVTVAVADQKCSINFGFCQYTSNNCSGSYVTGFCNGPYTRRCCIPAFFDQKCENRSGKCQSTSIKCHDGNYVPNLCGGPTNRRCCIPGAVTSYNDEKCTNQTGRCQNTSVTCTGGIYVRGLCGGPDNRRCCVSTASEEKGCSAGQKRLACKLHKSSNVIAVRRSPGEGNPNASAYNNLEDMCNGKQASRESQMCNTRCNTPGASTCLSKKLLGYLDALQRKGPVTIKELAGTCYSCDSFLGLAVDLQGEGRGREYSRMCRKMGGRVNARNGIIHCQF